MQLFSLDRFVAPLILVAATAPAVAQTSPPPPDSALETGRPALDAPARLPDPRLESGPEIALPGARWRVELDLTDFALVRDQSRGPDNRTMVFLHRDSRIQLSVTLRPAIGHLGPLDYRAARWKRLIALDPPETGETFWERAGVAYLEYSVEADHHLQAFLQHEGTRVEVHLSIRQWGGDTDRETVERLVASLAIVERTARWSGERR